MIVGLKPKRIAVFRFYMSNTRCAWLRIIRSLYVLHNRVSLVNLIINIHIAIPKGSDKEHGKGSAIMHPLTYFPDLVQHLNRKN